MKRKLIGILISTVLCVVSVGVLSSCKEKYTARYSLEDCYMQSIEQDYTKKYTGENYTAYFALSIDDVKTIDSWIDRFSEISSLLSQKEIDNSLTYFVGDGTQTNQRRITRIQFNFIYTKEKFLKSKILGIFLFHRPFSSDENLQSNICLCYNIPTKLSSRVITNDREK